MAKKCTGYLRWLWRIFTFLFDSLWIKTNPIQSVSSTTTKFVSINHGTKIAVIFNVNKKIKKKFLSLSHIVLFSFCLFSSASNKFHSFPRRSHKISLWTSNHIYGTINVLHPKITLKTLKEYNWFSKPNNKKINSLSLHIIQCLR